MNQTAKSLIIGANGLIGRQVADQLESRGTEWVGFYNKRPAENLRPLDITDFPQVTAALEELKPEVIYFCSNLAGGVNFCEDNLEKAKLFHVGSIQNLGGACAALGTRLVFISSDYVFPDMDRPAREDDPPQPLNIYGELKLEAELWIRENVPLHVIVRTTNVYGWDPQTVTPNYMMSLYRTLQQEKAFKAPSFLWGNPTFGGDLAAAMIELSDLNARGVFHVVGPDYVNRHEWALEACNILGLNPRLVEEIKVPPPDLVPRPMTLSLDTKKFNSTCTTVLKGFRQGLQKMKVQIENHNE
ncbi:SDR family oxidoreductase [Candidatus Contubernalis alkaliaceticus]|uniref:SDR family oxidoreductase n=1 Tax=Candidatus Contubernalis alkaliaceticus TaxID=338645 RepID=UPI001F4C3480|nr:SDR family oxidoreductase [Candidatus Contubernalis alkalaceticus]UNC93633.1 SDR family oxidoreductase [Candidatus Contubernalis alkalaceticus]